jgi:transcriptional regulator of acetoin/glycerol metabolism
MLAMNPPETVSFSDTTLLRMLSSRRHRPNLLIENKRASLDSVLEQLGAVCETPMSVCRFPGPLDLQADPGGTLVLANIDRMTIGQQLTLFDWLGRKGGDIQVVSITRAPMAAAIADGLFLEGLFFRLNTVAIQAVNLGDYCAAW